MKEFRTTGYFVTNDGIVFGKRGKPLKQSIIKGYNVISIYPNKQSVKVHRMVAECYIPNPKNLPQVNHINGIKTDNRVENLEWCNSKQNNNHRAKILKKNIGENVHTSKLIKDDINWIRKHYIPRHKEFGQRAMSRKFDVHYDTIYRIINNKSWGHITSD